MPDTTERTETRIRGAQTVKAVRAVRVLPLRADGAVLLLPRSAEGPGGLPGGLLHGGETERRAACRFLLEQTGIPADENALVLRGKGRSAGRITAYFLMFAEQAQAGRWVTPQDLLRAAASPDFDGATAEACAAFYPSVFAGCRIPRTVSDPKRREKKLAESADLCDAAGRHIGQTILRGAKIPAHTYRTVVSILTVTSGGRILITRRAKQKSFAGCWEITGGCVQAGETPLQAAVRELWEETGLRTDASELTARGGLRFPGALFRYFLLKRSVSIGEIRLQPGETDAAALVTADELTALHAAGKTVANEFKNLSRIYPEIFAVNTGNSGHDRKTEDTL